MKLKPFPEFLLWLFIISVYVIGILRIIEVVQTGG
jgi:hypothetical protein